MRMHALCKSLILLLLFIVQIDIAVAEKNKKKIEPINDTLLIEVLKLRNSISNSNLNYTEPWLEKTLQSLINYFENEPIDTVLQRLQPFFANNGVVWTGKPSILVNYDKINGYTPNSEIEKRIQSIEEEVKSEIPPSSIVVPEKLFVGITSKVNLVYENEGYILFRDSLRFIPDSLQISFSDPLQFNDLKYRQYIDSVRNKYIDSVRIAYNDSLISAVRNSISIEYRQTVLDGYTRPLKKLFLDSINTSNKIRLDQYNDSVLKAENDNIYNLISTLIKIADSKPLNLTFYNFKNDSLNYSVQNNLMNYKRFYLKNSQNDSVGIAFENIDRNRIKIVIDEMLELSQLSNKKGFEVGKLTVDFKRDDIIRKKNAELELYPWKFSGGTYLGFSQTYMNKYWSKGGKSSASTTATFNYTANYSKRKTKWENSFDLKLGYIYFPNETNISWQKNTDNYEFNSRFGHSAIKKWYYSSEVNFKSQLFFGYKYPNVTDKISGFMSPGYLTFSVGMDYKPKKEFSLFLSPITLKTTYVLDTANIDQKLYGLDNDQIKKNDMGMITKVFYTTKIMENILLTTKNSLFINFLDPLNWPDLDNETIINFKINNYISSQLSFHILYDKNVKSEIGIDALGNKITDTKIQLKEFFTLGLSFKF